MPESAFSGSFPHDLLDLNDWRWQGPIDEDGELGDEGHGDAVSIPRDERDTTTMEKFADDRWFALVKGDGPEPYVRLRSPAAGCTTSKGSGKTTRSELREMHFPHDDEKAAWDATDDDVHNLKVRLAVTKVMEKGGKRSRVVVAQVHKKDAEDGIIVYVDGQAGKLRWKQDSAVQHEPLGDYTLGRYVNIGLSVHDGVCTIYVDDVAKATGKVTGSAATSSYFKTGCYNQDNHADDGFAADAVNEVRIAAVRVQHGTAWASGGYAPVGPGVGTVPHDEHGGGQHEEIGPGAHGSKPRDLIQFNGPAQAWKLNLDVNAAGKHTGKQGGSLEKSAKALVEEDDGYELADHFEVVDGGTAVRFRSHLNGATTGGSKYPRTELREMQPDRPSEEADWDIPLGGHTVRRLTATVKAVRAPSTEDHTRVSIGQIHDAGDDLLQIMYDGRLEAVGYTWPNAHGEGEWQEDDLLVTDYPPGDRWFTYRVEVEGDTVRILVDDGHGLEEKVVKSGVSADGCYFKAGAYTQSSVIKQPDTADPHDYGEAWFRSIVVETEG